MRRRLIAVVLMVVATGALAGCDPWPVSNDETHASMSIDLGSEGGADVRLILGGEVTAHDPLLKTGRAVAAALFPSLHGAVSINTNGGGYPFVMIHARGVYQRGSQPSVRIDTRAALAVLASMGYRNVDVDVGAPLVPATARWRPAPDTAYNGHWYWQGLTPASTAPNGTMELRPHPGSVAVAVGLLAAGLASIFPAVLGLRRRRRLVAGASAAVAIASPIVYARTVHPNDLGVAGLVNGAQLNILQWLPAASGLAAIATTCLFVVTVDRTRPRRVVPTFNTPPGWPPAPPGWTPVPGWHPDPSWPPAPLGWSFYPPPNPFEPPSPKRWRRSSASSP